MALQPRQKKPMRGPGRLAGRRRMVKFVMPKDAKIEYKNLALLQRFVTDRGKILSRRITGICAKDQRKVAAAVKQARFLGLLTVGSSKRR